MSETSPGQGLFLEFFVASLRLASFAAWFRLCLPHPDTGGLLTYPMVFNPNE
jgi:hypothetical protein